MRADLATIFMDLYAIKFLCKFHHPTVKAVKECLNWTFKNTLGQAHLYFFLCPSFEPENIEFAFCPPAFSFSPAPSFHLRGSQKIQERKGDLKFPLHLTSPSCLL